MKAILGSTLAAVVAVSTSSGQEAPVGDHHQHLFSPAIVQLLGTPTGGPSAITARDLVALLDSAGIRRAIVLSVAYLFGSPARTVEDEYTKVRAENDWTVATRDQAAADAERVVRRIRQIGVSRVLFGSDAAAGTNLRPREAWAAFRGLPLTAAEFAAIARAEAPYLR